jgi:hypothetical protein
VVGLPAAAEGFVQANMVGAQGDTGTGDAFLSPELSALSVEYGLEINQPAAIALTG